MDQDKIKTIDDAAFGVIYGAVTVMGVLAATDPDHLDSFHMAVSLFVTVLAVTLTKAYADLASTVLKTTTPANRTLVHAAWAHSRTTLIAANGPTLAMLLAAAGLYSTNTALILAQVLAIGLLIFYGARIGWRLYHRLLPMIFGGAFTGVIGLGLSFLKAVLH
jgi:hypothetical protein